VDLPSQLLDWPFRLLGRQDWLRFGIRDRVIRAYCNPDRAVQREFLCDFFGLRYKGTVANFIDWTVYFFGAYEKQYLLFLERLLRGRTDAVFVDVGANVGQHALFMSRSCSQVLAFEPNPSVRATLDERIILNRLTNVTTHGVGLGAEDRDLPFYFPTGSNQGTGSFVLDYSANNDSAGATCLPVVNGDRYIASLGLERIDLIKIDVEGYEKNVLTGLRETLERFRPAVATEFSDATRRSFSGRREFEDLFPRGYRAKRIICDIPRFALFNDRAVRLREAEFDDLCGDILLTSSDGP